MIAHLRTQFPGGVDCDNVNRTYLSAGAFGVTRFIDEMIAYEEASDAK